MAIAARFFGVYAWRGAVREKWIRNGYCLSWNELPIVERGVPSLMRVAFT